MNEKIGVLDEIYETIYAVAEVRTPRDSKAPALANQQLRKCCDSASIEPRIHLLRRQASLDRVLGSR